MPLPRYECHEVDECFDEKTCFDNAKAFTQPYLFTQEMNLLAFFLGFVPHTSHGHFDLVSVYPVTKVIHGHFILHDTCKYVYFQYFTPGIYLIQAP